MAGFLLKSYKLLVPELIKKNISPRVKLKTLKFLFLTTGNIRMGIRYAMKLEMMGLTDECRSQLQGLYSKTIEDSAWLSRGEKQKIQFLIKKELAKLGSGNGYDPLFSCGIFNGEGDPIVGRFKVRAKFSGINISGKVSAHKLNNVTEPPKEVCIFLDDQCIRRESLVFDQNKARFSFDIKRPTLELFPRKSRIMLSTSDGCKLTTGTAGYVTLENPSGKGVISSLIRKRGLLSKKGHVPLSKQEIIDRQNRYLQLYSKVNETFEKITGRSLFLMYGTLLGLYRDNDFIPGDDDFDVGYVSRETNATAVKKETKKLVVELIKNGFTIVINRRGKPFRIRHIELGEDLHLDARPVWLEKDRIWAHKQACLKMGIDDFESTMVSTLRGTDVVIPSGTESFLKAYYGPGWRYPDPGFSNSSVTVSDFVKSNLDKCCFTFKDIKELTEKVGQIEKENTACGEFIYVAMHNLYPLDLYEKKCGW